MDLYDLSNVKAGDYVVHSLYNSEQLLTVERVTKTQVLAGNLRYNKKGRRCGDSHGLGVSHI